MLYLQAQGLSGDAGFAVKRGGLTLSDAVIKSRIQSGDIKVQSQTHYKYFHMYYRYVVVCIP